MQAVQQRLFGGHFLNDLFAEHETAASRERRADAREQGQAILHGHELQRPVQRHEARRLEGDPANVLLHERYRIRGTKGLELRRAALEHGSRSVDADVAQSSSFGCALTGEQRCAQRAAKVVEMGVFAAQATGQPSRHGDGLGVAGNGARNHVREHARDVGVEAEAAGRRFPAREETVGGVGHALVPGVAVIFRRVLSLRTFGPGVSYVKRFRLRYLRAGKRMCETGV